MKQVIYNKCNKQCMCSECELYDSNVDIQVTDDTKPFSIKEMVLDGYKCRLTGTYSLVPNLKDTVYVDDLITGELAKEIIRIENKYGV